MTAGRAEPVVIAGESVPPGERRRMQLPVARLFTGNWLRLPVEVINGGRPGPRLWMDAALHGDELNGVEIVRRVAERLDPERLAGTVIAVPIVNVFGFILQTRYLPDRRDLNRSFPGSAHGSLASRLAHLFMTEVVAGCQYGLDFHTGSHYRTNLAQIRADLKIPETRRIAEAFAAPLVYATKPISGSLRAAACKRGVHLLVYEAGEPLRFEESSIRVGIRGSLRVLAALGMLEPDGVPAPEPSIEVSRGRWLRAGRSGIFHLDVELGDRVERKQVVGQVADPIAGQGRPVRAPFAGIVIGYTSNPLVHQGDALLHLAREGRGDPGATASAEARIC